MPAVRTYPSQLTDMSDVDPSRLAEIEKRDAGVAYRPGELVARVVQVGESADMDPEPDRVDKAGRIDDCLPRTTDPVGVDEVKNVDHDAAPVGAARRCQALAATTGSAEVRAKKYER